MFKELMTNARRASRNEGRWARLFFVTLLSLALSGCYIFNWFKKDGGDDDDENGISGVVMGQYLGEKAGGLNESLLAEVHAIASDHPPAAIRPDPDLYVRRLLRQYRPEGVTMARQIGAIEPYRLLLGGASQDFSKTPQTEYDATSLLAVFKVAEEICVGLVAPVSWAHEGWRTILPYPSSQEEANVRWLAQRFIGRHSSAIPDEVVSKLLDIMSAEQPYLADQWWGSGEYAKYVPVCAALALDAEALYL